MKATVYCSTLAVLFGLLTGRAEAQFGGAYAGYGLNAGGVAAGAGVVTIERMPEQMRLEIDILSRADSLKEALAGLKDRSAAARAQLLALGANKDSLELGSPQIQGPSSEEQQMEQMLAARLRQGRGIARGPKKEESAPVTVSATLSASWNLKAKTNEDLLLEIEPLQKKIKDADISGQKDASKLSPEQQEIIDELGVDSFGYGNTGEAKPGEPLFLFAAGVSDDERDQALAEGFQKAKRAAARLAQAAGSELGQLRSLSAASSSGSDDADYGYNYNSPLYRATLKAQALEQADPDTTTAISAKAGPIVQKITVSAGFDLKQK